MKPRVLITETISREGVELLEQSCSVDVVMNPEPDALSRLIQGYDALVVRSRTQVSAAVLGNAKSLKVIGRPGIGVDNIDVEAATRHGVVVVNAPTATTAAVAEHTLGLMLALARNLCQANTSMHQGTWHKRDLMGTELLHKTLGIVGLGRIGSAVAQRARAFEMRVLAYDPFVSASRAEAIGAQLVSLEELLRQADYLSLHTPLTDHTRDLLGAEQLTLMRPEARLVNCARGGLVNEEALAHALRAGRLAGAALDVFTTEPEVPSSLVGCPNLLLTPHLGASTEESQTLAAVIVAEQVIEVLEGRAPSHPVNTPVINIAEAKALKPYLDLAQQLGRFGAQSTHDGVTRVEVIYAGEPTELPLESIVCAALVGLLAEAGDEPVNAVNARFLAEERGLHLSCTQTDETHGFAGLVTLRMHTTRGIWQVGGAIMRGQPRIVRVGDFWFDLAAEGWFLLTEHVEQPGVIGQMGTLLDGMGISISFVQVGRHSRGGYGLMVLGLDDSPPAEILDQVRQLPSVREAWLVRL